MKVPKDLGIKIVSEKTAFWTKVRDDAKGAIKANENEILVHKEILLAAERKLQEEKEQENLNIKESS